MTKEVYEINGTASKNWTNRAGSFLEQSRAFLDSYLGRWDRGQENEDEEEIVEEGGEECTSGATSGEDIWGTPTSGENDEMQMFNSDQTHSVGAPVRVDEGDDSDGDHFAFQSPTKSSSSLTGDDDTELMMDELLMAPPMTASTIRGLLPR